MTQEILLEGSEREERQGASQSNSCAGAGVFEGREPMASEGNRITIIRAGLKDLELAVPLFDSYRQFYKRPPDVKKARTFLRERLKRSESILFLAVVKEGLGQAALGFTHLYPTFSSLLMKPIWILSDLFVAPGARKRGVAKALMERARKLAVETKAEGLILETATDNYPAQRLYEQLGWKRDTEFYRYALLI